MMSQHAFNQISYVILAIMLIFLLLVAFRVVPVSWYWPMFAVVLVLFLVRTTLRLILARREKLDEEHQDSGVHPPEKPTGE
jgi:hypothetical protein